MASRGDSEASDESNYIWNLSDKWLGDHASRKVFIGGLSMTTTDEEFLRFFSAYGSVSDAVVMRDKHSGASRGFGFVTFENDESVMRVLNDAKLILDGRKIDAKLAVPKEEIDLLPRRTKKIFVGAMSRTTTAEEFKGYFSSFGVVTESNLVVDLDTGRSRCFGFVSYSCEDDVERVCSIKEHILNGKKVDVKKAMPKRLLPKSVWHSKDGVAGTRDEYLKSPFRSPISSPTVGNSTLSLPSKSIKSPTRSSSSVLSQSSSSNIFSGVVFGNQPTNLFEGSSNTSPNKESFVLFDDKGLLGDPADKSRFNIMNDTEEYNTAVASSLAALSLTDDDITTPIKTSSLSSKHGVWCHSDEPIQAINSLIMNQNGTFLAKLLTRALQGYANPTRIDEAYLEGTLLGIIFSSSSLLPADFHVHFQPLVGVEHTGSRRFADIVIDCVVDGVPQELIIELKHIPIGLVAEETHSLCNLVPWRKKHALGNAGEKDEFERALIGSLNSEYLQGHIDNIQVYLKAKFYQPLILPGDRMTIDGLSELWWLPTLGVLRKRVLDSEQLKSYCHARQFQSQSRTKVYRMSIVGVGPFITSSEVVLCSDSN